MPVLTPDGERIGKVRQLFTNGSGEVEQMLVKVDGATALLPAGNLSASGNAVMSAMTEGQIQQAAVTEDQVSHRHRSPWACACKPRGLWSLTPPTCQSELWC